ncbi:MAG: hypothetical protein HZB55_10205 [Deltaproteobacteria bacterium]|nr:hypothetical protein [Deltaproteobacteria bacterium]
MRRTTAAWLLAPLAGLLLASCSDQRTAIGTPHALGRAFLDRASPTFHGSAQTLGSLACTDCHELARKCFQCHFGPEGQRVPAGVTYTHGVIPHDLTTLKDLGAVCDRCHTLTKAFRNEPSVCHSCHGAPPTPHPLGREWIVKSASFHGNDAVLECSLCHDPATFCSECHFGPTGSRVPAGVTGWTHAAARTGHAAADRFTAPQQTVCAACHALLKSYDVGPQFTDCSVSSCHGFTYHGTDFQDAHPTAAHADLSACRACHDTPTPPPNFDGYVTGVACATCHTDALAHPPPPVTTPEWYVSHRSAGGTRAATCGICHKTDGPGAGTLPEAPSCFSSSFDDRGCHAQGPGTAPHVLGQAWLDPTRSTFHGDNVNIFPCQDCHDPNTFCNQCHFGPSGAKVPVAVTTWNHGTGTTKTNHAAKDEFTSAQQAVCTTCHTLTKSYNLGPQFTDCSTSGCHGFDYHGVGFFSQHPNRAKANLVACQKCHDTPGGAPDFNGYVTGVSCATCHPVALAHPPPPSSVNWVVSHRTSGNRPAACAICHKTDGPGDGPLTGAPSCFSASVGSQACHVGGPGNVHADGFAAASVHGPTAKADLTFCQQCHATPPTGGAGRNPRFNVPQGTLASGCETCHLQGTAHATNWQGQDGNRLSHRTAGNLTVACALCHGADLHGGSSAAGPSCFSASFTNPDGATTACHGGGYLSPRPFHPSRWVSTHTTVASTTATQTTCTTECHAANGTTTVNGIPGCAVCHFGPTGTKVPAGVTWTHGTSHSGLAAYEAVCNQCHTITRGLGNGPAACHDCHAFHPLGQPWMDKKSTTFHGLSAAASLTSCAPCHGSDYTGGTSGVSCFQCHFGTGGAKFPAGSTHPTFPTHFTFVTFRVVCNACHQENVKYGNASPTVVCVDCHAVHSGQPWMDKKSATRHGLAAATDLGSCAPCHGSDFRGGTAGVSCYTCHFTPLGNKSPTGPAHVSENLSGDPPAHAAFESSGSVCNECHATNRLYNNPPGNCHNCH